MDRQRAVMQCVAQMRKMPRFESSSDDQKAKAAAFAFERLHEDAAEHLAMGCSDDDVRHYVKAATKRIHRKLAEQYKGSAGSAEFEQQMGFPFLLILGLLPTLWNFWLMLKKWMEW